MKKILIRAGANPYEQKTAFDLMKADYIGGNVGNLIFAHSLFRNLTTDDTVLEADGYRASASQADQINETYAGFVIPLADAFRGDFENNLSQLTLLVKKLTIPVYLIGVGIKAPIQSKSEDLHFPYDDTVKEFIKAILEKSSIVGIRGEMTARYLTNLGFKEGTDHMVIGCPSMYTYGENLKIREIAKDKGSELLLSTNRSKSAPGPVLKYIHRLHETFEKASFVPQGWDEFKLMYTGVPTFKIGSYPSTMKDIAYESGNATFFTSAVRWITHMRGMDFSFGTKLHGNITATIAGTPSITIPIDARMKELADYHNLTRMTPQEIIENQGESLFGLMEKVDIHSAEKTQVRNYENFIHFLEKNNLAYTHQNETNYMDTPYDRTYGQSNYGEEIAPITACKEKALKERISVITKANYQRQDIYVSRQKALYKKIAEQEKFFSNLTRR